MIKVQKIKGRMKELNITQEELAKLLKINASTLNRKINDTTGDALSVLEAKQITVILKIDKPEDYFFCE